MAADLAAVSLPWNWRSAFIRPNFADLPANLRNPAWTPSWAVSQDLRARKLGSTADQGHVSLPDLILLKRQRKSMVDMGHHGTSWDIMGPWDIEVPCLVFDTSRLQAAAGQPFRGLAWIPGEVCDGLWILQTKEMDVNVIQQLFAVCTLLTLWRLVSVWPRIQSIQPPWVAM